VALRVVRGVQRRPLHPRPAREERLQGAPRALAAGGEGGHRTALLYSKGPVLLESIHRDLGDHQFLVFLRSVQTNLAWKFGTTRLVTQVLNAVAKKDYGPFLEENYWGLGLPPAK
jgi:hypothetical protein